MIGRFVNAIKCILWRSVFFFFLLLLRSEMKIIGSRNAPTATNVLSVRGMCQCATKRIMVLLCTHYNFSYARSDCWLLASITWILMTFAQNCFCVLVTSPGPTSSDCRWQWMFATQNDGNAVYASDEKRYILEKHNNRRKVEIEWFMWLQAISWTVCSVRQDTLLGCYCWFIRGVLLLHWITQCIVYSLAYNFNFICVATMHCHWLSQYNLTNNTNTAATEAVDQMQFDVELERDSSDLPILSKASRIYCKRKRKIE